jgi:hypothetical protein
MKVVVTLPRRPGTYPVIAHRVSKITTVNV